MVKVIHSSLRESRMLDNEDSVSSLWIWNSGAAQDTLNTSDDDDTKWYNNKLNNSTSNRSSSKVENSNSNRTSSSKVEQSPRTSPISDELSDALKSQKLVELSQAPSSMLMSPSTRKERLELKANQIPVRNPSNMSYNSDGYGIEGEMNLEPSSSNNKQTNNNNGWFNKSGLTDEGSEDATERGDSDYQQSPAASMSKYVKRLGTHSASSSVNSALHLQASDPDMQEPRVVEVDEDEDLNSVPEEPEEQAEMQDTAHPRIEEVEEADDVEDTAHQRDTTTTDTTTSTTTHTKSQSVPVSEAAKRQKRIEGELNDMIDEMMQSDDFYEEDEMEAESYMALMRAAKEMCYTRKYYDVSTDKIIYFPSITKSIVNNDLFEKAEEYYFEEQDEFPADYIMALRGIAIDQMVAAEEKQQQEEEELDDDTMMRLSLRVQRTEGEMDELQHLFAIADAQDEEEAEELEQSERESSHKPAAREQQEEKAKTKPPLAPKQDKTSKKSNKTKEHKEETKKTSSPPPPPAPPAKEDLSSPAGQARKKMQVQKEEVLDTSGMWWETTTDTEQKYKQVDRKSLMVPNNSINNAGVTPAKEEEEEEESTKQGTKTPDEEEIPQQRVSLWWDLGADSELKYKLKIVKGQEQGIQEQAVSTDDDASMGASTTDDDDDISDVSSQTSETEKQVQPPQSQVSLLSQESSQDAPLAPLPPVALAETKIDSGVSNKKKDDDASNASSEDDLSSLHSKMSEDQDKKGDNPNDVMKWLKNSDDASKPRDGLTREMSRISMLLPSKRASIPEDEAPPKLKQEHESTSTSSEADYESLPQVATVSSDSSGSYQQQETSTPKRRNSMLGSTEHDELPTVTVEEEDANGYKVDQMVPKQRKSKSKNVAPQESAIIEENAPEKSEHPMGDDTMDHTMLDDDIEDDDIDDDDDSSTASFEVENIIVVEKGHGEYLANEGGKNKYVCHDSVVSSLHASTWMADEFDLRGSLANMSLANSIDNSERDVPHQVSEEVNKHDSIGTISKITADNSALTGTTSDSILVRENPDGRSGTWSIGGSYENASKEDIVMMLRKIQSDIMGAIEQTENEGSWSLLRDVDNKDYNASSSSSGAFSLVLTPGVQRTISGITLSSVQAAAQAAKPKGATANASGKPKIKKTARKKVTKSPETGWKKVAMAPMEASPRTKRATKSKKIRDNTPLTNLSDVVEESNHSENPSTRSNRSISVSRRSESTIPMSNREGRKPVGERRTETRKPRKGRRREHDEADDFYDFTFSCKQPTQISDGGSHASSKSSIRSKGSLKRASSEKIKTGRSKSRSKSPSKTKARRSQSVSSTADASKLKKAPKHRRSASLEAHHIPPSRTKRGRSQSKALEETLKYEALRDERSPSPSQRRSFRSGHRRSVPLSPTPKEGSAASSAHKRGSSMEPLKSLGKKASMKFGRSSSVPAMNPVFSPIAKAKKKMSLSNRNFTDTPSTPGSSHRRDSLRHKKESSLRKLNRKLDEIIGIQSSPEPSPAPSLAKKKGLAAKVEEVGSIREKLRTSFVKVIKHT